MAVTKKKTVKKSTRGAKGKYSQEMVNEIIKYISAGNTNKDTCALVGINEDTFYTWIKEKPEFSDSIKKALSAFKARNLLQIQSAGKKQWQACAWILERKFPEEFGQRMKLTGAVTNINKDFSDLTEEQQKRILDEYGI